MKERSRATGERSGNLTRAAPRSVKVTPSTSTIHKSKGLSIWQQRLLLGLGLMASAIFLAALVWVIRSTALPELVPLLDLPSPNPAPTQVAVLASSATPTM